MDGAFVVILIVVVIAVATQRMSRKKNDQG
jgi:hypothetical protein